MQFGRTLERTLQQIRHADPTHGPVYLSKVDLADGFYRFGLALSGISKLGIVFPTHEGEEQLVAFPFVLSEYQLSVRVKQIFPRFAYKSVLTCQSCS